MLSEKDTTPLVDFYVVAIFIFILLGFVSSSLLPFSRLWPFLSITLIDAMGHCFFHFCECRLIANEFWGNG